MKYFLKHFFGRIRYRLRPYLTRRRLIIMSSIVVAFLLLTPMLTYAYYARDIADRDRLMNHNSTGVVMRDRNGEIFYKMGQIQTGEAVTLPDISNIVENALIASEDRDFRKHEGYSLRGMAVALYSNVLNRDATRYGGSTLTQQLVKNKLLTSEKNFLRKYQELSLAIAVERRYTKDEILEMYLNSVYFGEGAFGIGDAAKTYFGKTPADLTLAESSMLVGVLPAPSAYSPISGDTTLAKKQQERVLDSMVEAGLITSTEKAAALGQELAYNQAAVADNNQHARHYAEMVLEELKEKYGEEAVVRSGYDVTTALDLQWQKTGEENVRQQVSRLGSDGARNAGLVAIDPRTGHVRALVGSVDWNDPTFGKVNMATSPRQPGSSFKPIFYSEALDMRLITPASMLEDKPKAYGGTYRPTNYDFRYRGTATTRTALALSLNIPAVEVMQKLGVHRAAKAAQRFGVTTVNEPDKYGLSLALGTAETKLYDMVHAYGTFANKGEQHNPVMVLSIKDKFEKELFTEERASARRIISSDAAFLTSSILSDNQARAATFGSSLTVPGRQVAVKTGTTNDNKDAWTIGYTPSAVVGVWMGNNENQPMRGLAGSSSAGIVWRNTMIKYLSGTPREEFTRPYGVASIRICTGSGLRSLDGNSQATYEEVFIKGTEPSGTCDKPAPKPETKKDDKKKEEEEEEEEEPQTPGPNPEDEPEPTEEDPPVTPLPIDDPELPVAPTPPASPGGPPPTPPSGP